MTLQVYAVYVNIVTAHIRCLTIRFHPFIIDFIWFRLRARRGSSVLVIKLRFNPLRLCVSYIDNLNTLNLPRFRQL